MLRAVDLFCGCGGFSLGFRNAGCSIVAGIDSDPEALRTCSKNFPEAAAIEADISTLGDSICQQIGDVDILLGGPPCQGFSIAGKRQADDPRNMLVSSYLDLIACWAPKVVVIENVPNILNIGKGKFKEEIVSGLEKLGYFVSIEKLNAADFGIPQNRKRVFFLGTREFIWPSDFEFLKVPGFVSTADAISDLPPLATELGEERQKYQKKAESEYQKLMRLGSKYIHNHVSVDHKERTIEIISMVPDGGNYKDLPVSLQDTRKVNIAWTRMNSTRPCFTIDAGHNHHFHYKENRVPTVRECARIQSFPDTFIFHGKRTSQYRQVGNAVPPLMAESISKVLLEGG